jgi:hypothetical protein
MIVYDMIEYKTSKLIVLADIDYSIFIINRKYELVQRLTYDFFFPINIMLIHKFDTKLSPFVIAKFEGGTKLINIKNKKLCLLLESYMWNDSYP